jgi:hypothetical protein
MTVAELIEYLRTQPQGLPVIDRGHSEACLLEAEEIKIEEHHLPRSDGWVHTYSTWKRHSEIPKQEYLVLPGN